MYGTVAISKLFFDDLISFLIETMGFKPNSYDLCVVNKKIGGQQCTISWHVDDMKILHQDSNIITSVLKSLNNKYGTIMPLSVSRGKL